MLRGIVYMTGLVTLNRVRAVTTSRRPDTRLRDIACPPEGVPTARPDEPLTALLPRMRGCADGRAVVVDEQGRVIGIVSSTGTPEGFGTGQTQI